MLALTLVPVNCTSDSQHLREQKRMQEHTDNYVTTAGQSSGGGVTGIGSTGEIDFATLVGGVNAGAEVARDSKDPFGFDEPFVSGYLGYLMDIAVRPSEALLSSSHCRVRADHQPPPASARLRSPPTTPAACPALPECVSAPLHQHLQRLHLLATAAVRSQMATTVQPLPSRYPHCHHRQLRTARRSHHHHQDLDLHCSHRSALHSPPPFLVGRLLSQTHHHSRHHRSNLTVGAASCHLRLQRVTTTIAAARSQTRITADPLRIITSAWIPHLL